MKNLTKIIFFFLFFSLSFIKQPGYVFAQQSNSSNSLTTNDVININKIVDGVGEIAVCQLTGISLITKQHDCITPKYENGQISYVRNTDPNNFGILTITTNLIGQLYSIPISTNDSLVYLKENFGIVHPAYADGLGANNIHALLPVWLIFRNLCLSIFILLLTIIGILIMFRAPIDQRTIFTIEGQLPNIIIIFILFNFSFAIVGLMADGMHVANNFVFNLLDPIAPNPALNPINIEGNAQNNSNVVSGSNTDIPTILTGQPNHIFNYYITNAYIGPLENLLGLTPLTDSPSIIGYNLLNGLLPGVGTLFGTLQAISHGLSPIEGLFYMISADMAAPGATFMGDLASRIEVGGTNLWAPVLGVGASTAAYAILVPIIMGLISLNIATIFQVILIVSVFIGVIMLLIMLIKAFMSIIFSTVLAPLAIVLGIFPGSGEGFGHWAKGLIADFLLFPAVLGLFHLGYDIASVINTDTTGFFTPLFIPSSLLKATTDHGYGQLNFAHSGTINGLSLIVIYFTIFAAASLRDVLRKSLGVADNPLVTAAMGIALGGSKQVQSRLGLKMSKIPELKNTAQFKSAMLGKIGGP